MNNLLTRWLPAVATTSVVRKGALTVAGIAFASGVVASPVMAAQAAPQATPVTVRADKPGADSRNKNDNKNDKADNKNDKNDKAGPRKIDKSANRVLGVDYQLQPNYFYCGPASTRIALSAQGHLLSQDELAQKLGTTVAGTPSAFDITRVLNEVTGDNRYKTVEIPDSQATPGQIDQLQADVIDAIDAGRPVVANIKGTATDLDGRTRSYEGGHYLTVVGYRQGAEQVRIADPADPQQGEYWMSTITLANWIAERGYSA